MDKYKSSNKPELNKKIKFKSNSTIFYIFLLLVFVVLINILNVSASKEVSLTYSEFNDLITHREFNGKPAPKINKAEIIKVEYGTYQFHGKLNDLVSMSQLRGSKVKKGLFSSGDTKFDKFVVELPGMLDSDIATWNKLGFDYKFSTKGMGIGSILLSIFPWIFFIGLMFFMMRNMSQGGGGKGIFNFGKSKAKLYDDSGEKVTFADVSGCDDSKYELEEVIDFLKFPKKYNEIGAKIPKGILLVGPPGTGKTLLAKAVAGEANVPFFSISGSDFVEMFVGVGASRVRDMFAKGKNFAPCILFIDEIDAVARQRGTGVGGGHDEREQTLNQLLVEMDGMTGESGMIVIAATNRPDILDPAILRPGRFDRNVVIDKPDVKGREGVLKVHTNKRKIPLDESVDLSIIAKTTPGMSGAQLANIVNEAALFAARFNRKKVTSKDFEQARDKVMIGVERKSRKMSDKEKKLTAYHEAGHAICAHFIEEANGVHKVTIIPRGMALGLTHTLPKEEIFAHSRGHLLAEMAVLFGGRAAEILMFNEETTGASNDILRATGLARKMVCEWGMSEKVGPIALEERKETMFLGREVENKREYSEQTAVLIDSEIKSIITERMDFVLQLLEDKKDELIKLGEALIEYETVDSFDIDKIFKGEKLDREEDEIAPKIDLSKKDETIEESIKSDYELDKEIDEKEVSSIEPKEVTDENNGNN